MEEAIQLVAESFSSEANYGDRPVTGGNSEADGQVTHRHHFFQGTMIGKTLKIIRRFHNVKQKEFAQKTGLSPSYVSEIENGIKEPTLEVIQKYSDIFDIPVSSILFFSEEIKGKNLTERMRIKSAKKILKMMEWIESLEDMRDE